MESPDDQILLEDSQLAILNAAVWIFCFFDGDMSDAMKCDDYIQLYFLWPGIA